MEGFILGIIFSIMILPVLEGITTLLLTFLEMLKGKLGIIITLNNQRMEESCNKPTRQIGFAAFLEEEGEEYEDDDL